MIVIEIPLVAPSLNAWYAGAHWNKRKKVADLWHTEVMLAVRNMRTRLERFPVTITTRSFFRHRRGRDTSNCFTANKLVEDGLVMAGILPGDEGEYVASHIVLPPVFGAEKDMTVIKVEEY